MRPPNQGMVKKGEESSSKELTLADIKSLTQETNFEAVTYLNLYGCGISDVNAISLLKSLNICLLANNYINDLTPVLGCRNLFKLDASTNKINILPHADYWNKMSFLKILYLHDNTINKLSVFTELTGAPTIQVLTMFDTPVSLTKHYRHHAVNSIWSLKCLDQLVISDEEVIEDAKFKDSFCAYHPALRIGHLPYITREMTEKDAMIQSMKTLKLIEGVLRRHSPVIIIQRAWRVKLSVRRQAELKELRHWAAVCIQRYWRMVHNIPQKPCTAGIYSPITAPTSEPVTSESARRLLRSNASASPHQDYVRSERKTPFRISSDRLLENVKAKTSTTNFWGAVPFTAGLEGNVFAKRSGKVSEALKREVVIPTAGTEDEFVLVAEKTEFREPTTFRDIMSSSKEAGRVVREAANHFKEIQKYKPKSEPRTPKSNKGANSNSQRLFMKMQDNMALSCLKAVQQAYKNRAQMEAQAAKMDQVLLQRHQHKVMLARVDAIKNAARIEALQKREVDDSKLRDQHYQLHESERKDMMSIMKKREDAVRNKKEHRQYKQFITEFCCQNASLSKALARHDRRTVKDEQAVASQDKVGLLRDHKIRAQRAVNEYQDFVKLRRQAEAQFDRAQVNTVLIEDKKQRMHEVQERIDMIKSIRAKSLSPMPISSQMLDQTDENDIISKYKTSISKNSTHIQGVAIQPSLTITEKTAPKDPFTQSVPGFLKFDLTLPKAEDVSMTKMSVTDITPIPKLTTLVLNECSQFPNTPTPPRHERDIVI